MLIAWSPDDEASIVSVPERPGLHTPDAAREAVVAMGQEVTATWLARLRSRGRPVPPLRFCFAG